VILCSQNEKDIDEINPEFIKGVKFRYVKNMSQVLDLALE
jgi:ATP-dependent Lon protease